MTIPSILKNTHYQVVEDVYTLDGYTTQPASRDISGDLTADQQVCTADFLNIRNVGELIVEKALAGNGASTAQSFSFTVTLSRTDAIPYNLTYACELIEGAAGARVHASVTAIEGGDEESHTISDLVAPEASAVETVEWTGVPASAQPGVTYTVWSARLAGGGTVEVKVRFVREKPGYIRPVPAPDEVAVGAVEA